jgi:hypothetical protein
VFALDMIPRRTLAQHLISHFTCPDRLKQSSGTSTSTLIPYGAAEGKLLDFPP